MLNSIDTPLQPVPTPPATTGKSEGTAVSSTTSNPAFLTDGRLDINKLLLEIQKLLHKMLSTLQDYMQKQLGQSYKIQQAAFESQDKVITEKKAAAQAALIGGSIASALGILGSFAAINQGLGESGQAAGKAAKEAAETAAKASTKALESTTDTLTKTLAKTADNITDSVTDGIEAAAKTASKTLTSNTSEVSENIADTMQRTSQAATRNVEAASEAEKSIGIGTRLMNGVGKVTSSLPFVAVTNLAQGIKELPTTIADSIRSTHEISEQQHKNVENLQQGNLELYRQDLRRSQDDIASRQADITSVTREFLSVQNRLGQSARGAG